MITVGPYPVVVVVRIIAYGWACGRLVQARSPVLRATALIPAIWIWSLTSLDWYHVAGQDWMELVWGAYVGSLLAIGLVVARLMPTPWAAAAVYLATGASFAGIIWYAPLSSVGQGIGFLQRAIQIGFGLAAAALILLVSLRRNAFDGRLVNEATPILVAVFAHVILIWHGGIANHWYSSGGDPGLIELVRTLHYFLAYLEDVGFLAATWYVLRSERA
ncbi:MAG: hypothetical protein U0974_01175 [Gemmatimonadales bacterium]|nr:hypothetical protein [Gemmatimonadales bacterium]MDZ4388328.1 hypothetical protein [Gemmatimonadales bacterium]